MERRTPTLTVVLYVLRDPRNREIVRLVKENAVATIHEISVRLSIPYASAWTRVRNLENLGILRTESGPQHSRLVTINPIARRVVERALELLTPKAPKKRK